MTRRTLSVAAHVKGVRMGDRAIIGRTITLIESHRADHQDKAQAVLEQLLPHTGGAYRVGISGAPGVGKSTFIERFGKRLTGAGRRVAVLAVDPSSSVTGGSVLGDKTRMNALAIDPHAFIRPSPSSGTLGGVARRTRESMLVLEAAGFDVILVETVGVGQSEMVVKEMVDFFLMLMLPGAGDELQGIKRGILEVCDLLAINKADGDREAMALQAKAEYVSAFRILRSEEDGWRPEVITVSALKDLGLDKVWKRIEAHKTLLGTRLLEKRSNQRLRWTWRLIEERALDRLKQDPSVLALLPQLEAAVLAGRKTPLRAAEEVLTAFFARQTTGP